MEKIIWEHGRRNFALRADCVLSIVCAVSDESNVSGVGIFNAPVEEVRKIMDEDPVATNPTAKRARKRSSDSQRTPTQYFM
ncbi:MAG: hypothetical protein WB581_10475 [Halobacteriota archaeon]